MKWRYYRQVDSKHTRAISDSQGFFSDLLFKEIEEKAMSKSEREEERGKVFLTFNFPIVSLNIKLVTTIFNRDS